MLQSKYEHLYDHITLDNMDQMKRLPTGTVIPEQYYLRKIDEDGIEHFSIFCIGQWFEYHSSRYGGDTLYTNDNRPSVWHKPTKPYLNYENYLSTETYGRFPL